MNHLGHRASLAYEVTAGAGYLGNTIDEAVMMIAMM